MEFIVWVETRLAGKTLAVEEVAKIDRCASGIASEEIGLSLQEGKDVLKHVQRNIVQTQVRVQSAASSCCMCCSATQLVKDIRRRQIRTVFGKITVACRRYIRCTCRGGGPIILWPLGLIELPGSYAGAELPIGQVGQHLVISASRGNARRVAADFRQ